MDCACSALSRIASNPPCTLGCRVLTRPSIISGNPVSSDTSATFNPAAAIALAVPPVETRSMPWPASARANSIRPDLSETDNKARVTRRGWSVMSWSWIISSRVARFCQSREGHLWKSPSPLVGEGGVGGRRESGACGLPLSLTLPHKGGGNAFSSQRQFGLAARVALCRGRGGRGGRADKTPADAGGAARILLNHDLGGAPRAIGSRQEYAVCQFDLVVERLEGPDVAVRQHQHDAARVAKPARLHRSMQVKPQGIIGIGVLHARTGRRHQRVLAVEPGAVRRDHQDAAMQHAELRKIAVMRCRQQQAIGDLLAIAFDICWAAD